MVAARAAGLPVAGHTPFSMAPWRPPDWAWRASNTPLTRIRWTRYPKFGNDADLVLLGSDPLLDIENTRDIQGVVLRGRFLAAEEVAALLGGVSPKARGDVGLVRLN